MTVEADVQKFRSRPLVEGDGFLQQLVAEQELLCAIQEGDRVGIQARHQTLMEVGAESMANCVGGYAQVRGVQAGHRITMVTCPQPGIDGRVDQSLNEVRPVNDQFAADRPHTGIGIAVIEAEIHHRAGAGAFQFRGPGQPTEQGVNVTAGQHRGLTCSHIGKQVRTLEGRGLVQLLGGDIDTRTVDRHQLDVVHTELTVLKGVQQRARLPRAQRHQRLPPGIQLEIVAQLAAQDANRRSRHSYAAPRKVGGHCDRAAVADEEALTPQDRGDAEETRASGCPQPLAEQWWDLTSVAGVGRLVVGEVDRSLLAAEDVEFDAGGVEEARFPRREQRVGYWAVAVGQCVEDAGIKF